MHSLFLKIFLWFWFTMAAIGIAIVLVTAASSPEELNPPQRELISAALQSQAERAIEIYEKRGRAALQKHLNYLGRRSGAQIFLFDASGREVLGRRTPDAVRLIRRQIANDKSHQTSIQLSGSDALAAVSAKSKKNEYVFVGIQARALWRAASFGANATSTRMKLLRLFTVLLVTGAVCYGLARYLAAPAVELRRATRRLAAGDLSTRVAPKFKRRRDELADLARDFDAMAARIEVLVVGQRRLLADISHELRSPLARLRLAQSLAERNLENHDDAKARENLKINITRIETETARMDALIGQLLSLTRLESGEAQLKTEEFNLKELAQEIAADADFEARAQSKRVLLQCDEGDNFRVSGDRALLASALENVVRNALRHTPENSDVAIELKNDNGAVRITVCDEGSGVSKENLARLFEPFFREGEARAHDGGTGLGLAITRRAVESHGGKVRARNRESGGLCVEMKLPTIRSKA